MKCNCDFVLQTEHGWEDHYDNCSLVWSTKYCGTPYPKNDDGTLRLANKHLSTLEMDVLYHLGLDTKTHDLPAMFGDVKFVVMGGTKYRMKEFAGYIGKLLGVYEDGYPLVNITKHAHRYAMYKVGPVLIVNHGIGIPSMTVVLQEVIKLMYYAKAKDPIFFRLGTSGGLTIPAGSVVISSWCLSGTLEKTYDIPILGKMVKLPAVFDARLAQEVNSLVTDSDGFKTYIGGTMAADDFYRGQARLDGPFCDYKEEDKMKFLRTLADLGVKNIEMEATAFAAFTKEAGVRAGDVCVTFLDRLNGDQVTTPKDTLNEWQIRPMVVIGKYIVKYIEKNN